MKKCLITQIEDASIITLSCDNVRRNLEKMKSDFREKNGSDALISKGIIDRKYEEYCKSLMDFLKQCTCHLTCNKCSQEDHEGYFCRCEDRNIALAKRLREEGKSPWIKADISS